MIRCMSGRAITRRLKHGDFITHGLRRMREHATELTTTHHT
jgi:hypothetical protein